MRLLNIACWLAVMALWPAPASAQTEAPPYLTSRDSLWLTVTNGQKFVYHPVKARQTLFSLARFYGLSLEELYEHNAVFRTDPMLRVGQRVKIPVPNRAIKRYKTAQYVASKHAPIYYVVQSGDNLFQICKRYFAMPVDTIVRRNRLRDNSIQPGQLLLMGWMGTEGVPPDWRPKREVTTNDILQGRFEQERTRRREQESQGVAFWQKDSKEEGDLYILHREAIIGSVIAVTNPMSGRVVYAKCIGRIPEGYERNLECILSPAAARRIGARDPRFFVKLRYLN
jgi:LysM repeat protein